MHFILILSRPFHIQGKEPHLRDFIEKNFDIGMYSDVYKPVSFRLGTVIETIDFQTWYNDRNNYALDFNTSLDDLDLHARSQSYEKLKSLVSIFLQI